MNRRVSEIDLGKKVVLLRLQSGKEISIKTTMNIDTLIKYENIKKQEEDINFRFLSCNIIYNMIIGENHNVTIEEIIETTDKSLQDVITQIINNSNLTMYFVKDTDLYRGFINALDSFTDKFTKDITKAFKPLSESLKSISEAVKPLSEMVRKSFEPISKMTEELNKNINENMKNALAPLVEYRSAYSEVFQKHSEILNKLFIYGNVSNKFYIIMLSFEYPPFTLSYDSMKEIVDCAETTKGEELETIIQKQIIMHYCEDTFNEMIGVWNSQYWLSRRIKILKEVVQSYSEGKYSVVVPTMLAQVEGIIAEGFNHKGSMNGSKYKGYIDILFNEDGKGITSKLELMASNFIKNVILVQFFHGQELTSTLSRHAILHGADTEYGTQINALKAIIMFDFIQEMISEKKEDIN